MLNKCIKIGLMATTFSALALTTAFTISCAADNSLAIGIRPEDVGLWAPIAEEFEEATGTPVKFLFVSDMNNNYRFWSSSNSMPHITIADSGVASQGYDEGWFQSFNMKDLVENPKYMIEAKNPDYKESQIFYNEDYFEWQMMRSVEVAGEENIAKALPAIYGPQITYSWKTAPKGNSRLNLFAESTISDNVVPIRWYTPPSTDLSATGWIEEQTDFFKPNDPSNVSEIKGTSKVEASLNPLVKVNSDGIPIQISSNDSNFEKIPTVLINDINYELYTNTEADAQSFINNSARKSQMKISVGKDKLQNTPLNELSSRDKVITTGPTGQYQRIASLFETIRQSQPEALKNYSTLVGAVGLDFTQITQGNAVIWEGEDSNFAATIGLDDKKWFNDGVGDPYKWNVGTLNNSNPTTADSMSLIEKLLFYELGYFHSGSVASSYMMGEGDDTGGFASRRTLALNGAKWQFDGIVEKISLENFTENDITAFSFPFQTAAVDGYAITKEVSDDKLLTAKKFLRFMMQPKAAAGIASNKAIPVVIEAKKYQPSVDNPVDKAILNGGRPKDSEISPADQIDTTYILTKQSNLNYFDLYNNHWLNGDYADNPAIIRTNGITLTNFMKQIDARNADYQNDK